MASSAPAGRPTPPASLAPRSGNSPDETHLTSTSDHWQELESKCAKIEQANMRISHIDLSVTGTDSIVQYSFAVDDSSEAGSCLGSPPLAAPPVLPNASVPSAEIEIREAEDLPQCGDLLLFPKSNSITSPSEIKTEMATLAELPAADPAILNYFQFVEEVLAEGDDGVLGAYPEGTAGAPSEYYQDSVFCVFSEGVTASPAMSYAELDGAAMRRSVTNTAGNMAECGGDPFSTGFHGPVMGSSSASARLPRRSDHLPGPLVQLAPASRNLSGQLSSACDSLSPGLDYPQPAVQQLENASSPGGGESPPWRKPKAVRIGGNCDELLPTNCLEKSVGGGKKGGRKLLQGLFRGKPGLGGGSHCTSST